MTRHRLRTTLVLLVAALISAGSWVIATTPAAAATTKELTVRIGNVRLVLTVPSSWHVSRTAPTPQCGCGGDFDPVCIVASGDYRLNPNNCELIVGGNFSSQRLDVPVPGYRLPRCDSWTTTYEADSRIGDLPGEYRIFLDRCHDRKSEQWTSLTTPSVSIWHPLRWSADDTTAANAVRSVQLFAKGLTRGRTDDLGYVRNVFIRNGHTYVTIDRAVLSLSGRTLNHNPATYVHRIRRTQGYPGCPRFLDACSPLSCAPSSARARTRRTAPTHWLDAS
jgi:hypothetical protein